MRKISQILIFRQLQAWLLGLLVCFPQLQFCYSPRSLDVAKYRIHHLHTMHQTWPHRLRSQPLRHNQTYLLRVMGVTQHRLGSPPPSQDLEVPVEMDVISERTTTRLYIARANNLKRTKLGVGGNKETGNEARLRMLWLYRRLSQLLHNSISDNRITE